jgi:prenyltransferase beta subunit
MPLWSIEQQVLLRTAQFFCETHKLHTILLSCCRAGGLRSNKLQQQQVQTTCSCTVHTKIPHEPLLLPRYPYVSRLKAS